VRPACAGPAPPPDIEPPLNRIRLAECLRRLGWGEAQVADTDQFMREWIVVRSRDTRWRDEGTDLGQHLRESGQPEAVVRAVLRFAEQLLAWCSPRHARGASIYISTRKLNEAWRLLRAAGEAQPGDESPHERLAHIHQHLLESQRLVFLPARLLLGGTLPSHDDEIVYFSGKFELQVDRVELERVPGALETFDQGNRTNLYSVVANVFGNPDPFAYPLLRFFGRLGEATVTMVLSRRNIEFSSMTATTLASALEGVPMELDGIGTFSHRDGSTELHPLACGAWYGG
jgi:hypothetical protein